MIDFTLAPEHEAIRLRVRTFVEDEIKPAIDQFGHREEMSPEITRAYVSELIRLRKKAVEVGLWLPHMPKEWGGMGLGHVALAMVQAEALAAGVPVLCTDRTGGQDLFEDGIHGMVVSSGDSDILAEKIGWAFAHQEDLFKMGLAGQQHIKKHTWNAYGKKIVKQYDRVMAR